MATETLPALTDAGLPEGLSDLEGWGEAELVAWATEAGRRIAQGESLLERMRLGVGLVLWKLRQEVGDGRYGLLVAEMAEQLGYSVRTLQGWRSDAQTHHALPAPDARSAGQQKAADARGSAHPAPAPQGIAEKIRPSEVIPPQPDPAPRGKIPPPAAPAFQQLALPLEEAIQNASLEDLVALPEDAWASMKTKIAEAEHLRRRLSRLAPAGACSHPKAMHKTLPYGTYCDKTKGGCGTKVR